MNDSAPYRLAAVAALYAAYLVVDFVLGGEFASARLWHELAVIIATAGFLAWAGLRSNGVARRFLLTSAAAIVFLFVAEGSYNDPTIALGAESVALTDVAYIVFLFGWICSWGYLSLELARRSRPAQGTLVLFAILMVGFALLFTGFYYPIYHDSISTLSGRVDVAMAALELAGVIAGLAAILLGVSTALLLQIYGVTLLVAADMLYSTPDDFSGIDPVWMLGLHMLLAGALVMPYRRSEHFGKNAVLTAISGRTDQSGLSGLLLGLSLGAVLLSAIVALSLNNYFDPTPSSAGEPFFLILFIVLLVVVMVWITSRFDRAVAYAGNYLQGLLHNRLTGGEWRDGDRKLTWILGTTGLGAHLDSLRAAAAGLKRDVLFLGPERLNPPPVDVDDRVDPQCFIMMPFGLEESDEVHHILRKVCKEAGVRPVRGDDLFTPTDILDDIWRGITGARFIIADITGRNPNVLYELGMAHTLAKPVLILSRNADDIPIDLSTRRVILYDTSGEPDWQASLARKATAAIQTMLRDYAPETAALPASTPDENKSEIE